VSLTWARIFYPYGKGEHPQRLISTVIVKLLSGETVTLKTPCSIKDYIHADDVGSALLKLVEQGFNGSVNVGTGDAVSIETITRTLAELLGRPELICVPEKIPEDPLDFVVADATRLRSFGWRPEVPLEAGLRRQVKTLY
jgi:nucleoside-diphosphate-sugar epimerase